MKAKNILNRQHDAIAIQGFYTERYTPSADQVYSQKLGKYLAYAQLMLDADAVVSYVDYGGSIVTNANLAKGRHTFLVSKVTSCSQIVSLVHDGILSGREVTMTSRLYPAT